MDHDIIVRVDGVSYSVHRWDLSFAVILDKTPARAATNHVLCQGKLDQFSLACQLMCQWERGEIEGPRSIVYSWRVGGHPYAAEFWSEMLRLKVSDQPSDVSGSFILPFTHMHAHTHSDATVWNNEVVLKQMDHQVFVISLSEIIAGFQVNGPIKFPHCWGYTVEQRY